MHARTPCRCRCFCSRRMSSAVRRGAPSSPSAASGPSGSSSCSSSARRLRMLRCLPLIAAVLPQALGDWSKPSCCYCALPRRCTLLRLQQGSRTPAGGRRFGGGRGGGSGGGSLQGRLGPAPQASKRCKQSAQLLGPAQRSQGARAAHFGRVNLRCGGLQWRERC